MWQGLGYYSRARNLLHTARHICANFNGVFPDQYDQILKLKGVGPYTAAAIASFAFGLSHPVVDGNVKRVIARLYNITDPVDKTNTHRLIMSYCVNLIQHASPEIFNQAIMEFGALQCLPKNPSCSTCPLQNYCQSHAAGTVTSIPVKSKKIKKKVRYFNFGLFLDSAKNIWIEKRSGQDIWKGLYQLPLLESDTLHDGYLSSESFGLKPKVRSSAVSPVVKHILTHQLIYARFHHFISDRQNGFKTSKDMLRIPLSDIHAYAVPRLIDSYLADLSISLF